MAAAILISLLTDGWFMVSMLLLLAGIAGAAWCLLPRSPHAGAGGVCRQPGCTERKAQTRSRPQRQPAQARPAARREYARVAGL